MDRSQQLIRTLGLLPHPEGGHYRRICVADGQVMPTDGRPQRPAQSAILFLLRSGEYSRWHQLDSDEVWTWIEGATLQLRCFEAHTGVCAEQILASPGRGACVHAVAARCWQSACTQGPYTLVSCAVAPAFDFADFRFMADVAEARAALAARCPAWLDAL